MRPGDFKKTPGFSVGGQDASHHGYWLSISKELKAFWRFLHIRFMQELSEHVDDDLREKRPFTSRGENLLW